MASLITIPGACNCKAVTFTLTIDPASPPRCQLCHCTTCRNFTGSLFLAIVFPHEDSLKFDAGASSNMKRWEDTTPDSGNTIYRYFCNTCSSPIYIKDPTDTSGFIDINAMTLDLTPQMKAKTGDWSFVPDEQLFCRNSPEWLGRLKGLGECWEGMPVRD